VPRLEVVAQVRPDHRRAAEAAADQEAQAQVAVAIAVQVHADVVEVRGGAVLGARAVHGDLELARQEGELRVQR
jgi:hypothetical protein